MLTADVIDCDGGQLVCLPEDAYVNADNVRVIRRGEALLLTPLDTPLVDVDEAQERMDELLGKIARFGASFVITVDDEPVAILQPYAGEGD